MAYRAEKHVAAETGGGLMAFLSGCMVIALGLGAFVLHENNRLGFSPSAGITVIGSATAAEAGPSAAFASVRD